MFKSESQNADLKDDCYEKTGSSVTVKCTLI